MPADGLLMLFGIMLGLLGLDMWLWLKLRRARRGDREQPGGDRVRR